MRGNTHCSPIYSLKISTNVMIAGAEHGLRGHHYRDPVRGDQPSEDPGRRPRGHQHPSHHLLHREQASVT